MEYESARNLLTNVVEARVSSVEPAAAAQLEGLIAEGAIHLSEQPERADEAAANFEDILRHATEGPYDAPQPTALTLTGLELALGRFCPPPVFPICPHAR